MVALEEAISRRSPGGGDHGAAGVVVVEHVDATIGHAVNRSTTSKSATRV